MSRMTRLTTVLTLLVAFMASGLVPAAGSWSCADGTACVFTAGRGFHCAGDQCQLVCCVVETPGRGCGRCDHGAVPGITNPDRSRGHAIGEAAHCRYREAPQAEIVWAPVHAAPDLPWHAVAVLPAPVELPVVDRLWERLAPIRGSPPARRASPSSSPRAPPGPDCA